MNEPAIRLASPPGTWPMTVEAWRSLVDELAQLRIDVAILAGAGSPEDGVVHLPAIKAARRLDVLTAVLEASTKVREPGRVVIGRRATLLEEDGETVSYAIVFPGDGDPFQGWISADSPLGVALMGCTPGDVVEVSAPMGRRAITVLAVQ